MLPLRIMVLRSIRQFTITLAAVLLPLTTAAANESSDGFSFRPHPLPNCRSFAVFHLGVAYRLNEGRGFFSSDSRACLSMDLGYMRNLSRENAVGFSVFGLTDERGERGGVRARYRRWLSPHVGVDATAGMMLAKGGEFSETMEAPAIIASVGIEASGLVGAKLEVEQIRFAGGGTATDGTSVDRTDWDWRIGAHLGSGAGVVGTLILGALVGIWIASAD